MKNWFVLICFLICTSVNADVQQYFSEIQKDPIKLYVFLKSMPKGGELHYHLAGGPYPETLLELASEHDYCLDSKSFVLSENSAVCNGVSTKSILAQPELYAKTVRSWSLKEFFPKEESAHDHFFNTFLKFTPVVFAHRPALVADVLKRASNQNELYLEIMIMADNGRSIGFQSLINKFSSLADKRQALLKNADFQKNVQNTVEEADIILPKAKKILHCDTSPNQAECKLTIKFLYYSLREQSFDGFFAQTLNAFEAVSHSQKNNGDLVGVNLVQPEEGVLSIANYRKQMEAYRFFHELYPKVNISLHAGELTEEYATPAELSYHINDALKVGQAQRIGHGADIFYENNSSELLDYMAKMHKVVEINLTSSEKLLNVSGIKHPLNYYLSHHVPVVLSTDDEGILRTDLTQQYVEAAFNHHLSYLELKRISRNALTYAFISGNSIWENAEQGKLRKDCEQFESPICNKYVSENPKAKLQIILEKNFLDFEKNFHRSSLGNVNAAN